MFVHPEDDYDFVVKLRPAVLPRYFQNVIADTAVWVNDTSLSGEALTRPGFDPAEKYLDDLAVREGFLSCRPGYLYSSSAYLHGHGQVLL